MPNLLKRLEQNLRRLMEESIGGRFKGRVHPLEVARGLAHAMMEGRQDGVGSRVAPNVFEVHLHPGEETPLLALGERFYQELTAYIEEEARSRDLTWNGPIRIDIVPHADVPQGKVRCTGHVQGTPPRPASSDWEENTLQAPTLEIVLGFGTGQRFPVRTPRSLLGRGEDVDIRVGDPAVSRHHAAIVWKDGRFHLEDLHSRRGTQVNGVAVTSMQVLNAGDEISIGFTTLRFIAAVRP